MALNKVSTSIQFIRRESSGAEPSSETFWVPNTDVYQTDGGLVIKVELAGMNKDKLSLAVEGNRLVITGQRPDGCREGRCQFLVMEINYGPFESIIELPAGYDLGKARAAYLNGFLRIDVPEAVSPTSSKVVVPISTGEH